ncbi:hypothetical protein Hanom_Chr05g00415541 [Helianthus anomalus]
MAKIPEPDGYTRNPKDLGWYTRYPGQVWVSEKIFRGYETGMGLDDMTSDPITQNYIPI